MKKNEIQVLLLQVLICLTFYILFQNVIMVNIKNRVETNRGRIIQQQQEYMENINRINSLEKKYREYYRLKYQRDYMQSKLINEGEERYLTEKLTDISIKNKIKLADINLSESSQENGHKYILNTRFETDFFTLKKFLNDIDRLDKNINLEEIEINSKNFNLTVTANFSIYTTN